MRALFFTLVSMQGVALWLPLRVGPVKRVVGGCPERVRTENGSDIRAEG